MNFKSILKKVLTMTCVYFTAVTAIYSVIVMIVYVDDTAVLLDASRVLLFFIASFLFALANGVFALEKLSAPAKFFIHYLLTLFAFYSCMMLPISPAPNTLLVGLALFSIVYFIAAAIFGVIRARYRSRANQTAEYKSQFAKK